MIVFSIDIPGKPTEVRLKNKWEELVLSDAKNLHIICDEYMPKSVRNIYEFYANGLADKQPEVLEELLASITDEDNSLNLPIFYGHLIKALSDIEQDILDRISPSQRTGIYEQFLVKLISELLYFPAYELKNIKSFTLDNVEYFLPITDEGIDRSIPMEDRTAIEFTETADLEVAAKGVAAGKYEYASTIISILCRPKVKGKLEKYDQKTCVKRADIFLQLPMPIVFEVFFCFIKRLVTSGQLDQISFQKEEAASLLNGTTVGMPQLFPWLKRVHWGRLSKSSKVTYTTG